MSEASRPLQADQYSPPWSLIHASSCSASSSGSDEGSRGRPSRPVDNLAQSVTVLPYTRRMCASL
ncbi:hypothetical protein [Embleya sp. MST-111070]|uniref:hypothetical protein n=1 Tax=Embleya sp. MST-111070 TaxID=3398231 RepID=UPI003F7329B4